MRRDCRGKGPVDMARLIEVADDGDVLIVGSEAQAKLGRRGAERMTEAALIFEVEAIPDDVPLSAFGPRTENERERR